MNTTYEAKWGTATSKAVKVKVRPRIRLAKIGSHKYSVRVKAAKPFAGKYVLFQKRTATGTWVKVKMVTLKSVSTIGTTTDSAVTAVDFTLSLNPQPFYALDGTVAAQAIYRPAHRTWTAQITRQYNAVSEFSAFQAKTIRKVRVLTTGPVLGTSTYLVQQDMYGVYTARDWAEVNGIVTEVLTLEPVFDVTSATSTSITINNNTASIS